MDDSFQPLFLIIVLVNKDQFWHNTLYLDGEQGEVTLEEIFVSQFALNEELNMIKNLSICEYHNDNQQRISGKLQIKYFFEQWQNKKEAIKIVIHIKATFIVQILLDEELKIKYILEDLPLSVDLQQFINQAKAISKLENAYSLYEGPDYQGKTIQDILVNLGDLNDITIMFSSGQLQSPQLCSGGSLTSSVVEVIMKQTNEKIRLLIDYSDSVSDLLEQIKKAFQIELHELTEFFFDFNGENLRWKNQQAHLSAYDINGDSVITVIPTKNDPQYLKIIIMTTSQTAEWMITKQTTFDNLSDYLIDFHNKKRGKNNQKIGLYQFYYPADESQEYKRNGNQIISEVIQVGSNEILASYEELD